jgi:hypothetical protein
VHKANVPGNAIDFFRGVVVSRFKVLVDRVVGEPKMPKAFCSTMKLQLIARRASGERDALIDRVISSRNECTESSRRLHVRNFRASAQRSDSLA